MSLESRLGKPKRSAYDDELPVQFRDKCGLWVRGEPTKVLIYSSTGELIVGWRIPSTALACTLCGRAAKAFLMNPSRFTFQTFSEQTQTSLLFVNNESYKPLTWVAKFEPVIHMKMFVRELDENETKYADYGWRVLRKWRSLTYALLRN